MKPNPTSPARPPAHRQTRVRTRLLGGFVPLALHQGVEAWLARAAGRNRSDFLREAVRAKLAADLVDPSAPPVAPLTPPFSTAEAVPCPVPQ